jgi:hypothetical protein
MYYDIVLQKNIAFCVCLSFRVVVYKKSRNVLWAILETDTEGITKSFTIR